MPSKKIFHLVIEYLDLPYANDLKKKKFIILHLPIFA